MAGNPLRTAAGAVALVAATSIATGLTARGVLSRELERPPGASVDGDETARHHALLREFDLRLGLTGGIATCLAVAVTLLATRKAGPRPAPPGQGAPSYEAPPNESTAAAGGPPPGARGSSRETPAGSVDDGPPEVAALRRRLARTERIAARREVARQVAHEIKNPLAPIQASVETLRRLRARGAPEFDEYFDEATRTVLVEVRRIARIVTEFSEYARMPPPRFARLDLGSVLQGVAALHDSPVVTGGARVRLELAASPALLGDEDQLTRAFTNLVKNGVEAASNAGVVPHVTLTVEDGEGGEIRVLVRDNGPGVEPTIRDRLFEPYVTTKHDGTGLGLALVQTIVHEHGGEVRLCDDSGGATFEVTLPLAGPRPPAPPPSSARDPERD